MKKLIVANWKMQLMARAALKLAEQINRLALGETVDLVLCPSFTAIFSVAELSRANFELGAQDVFWEESGAFTGEISPRDLKQLGCRYAIIGHSERRQFLAESNEMVSRKVRAALNAGLLPIICVGETAKERSAGQKEQVVERQVKAALEKAGDLSEVKLTIAYEPVWAIGTGRTPTPSEIQEMHRYIAALVSERSGGRQTKLKVIYGGSVDASNIADFLQLPEVTGALVGGASSDFKKFKALLNRLS